MISIRFVVDHNLEGLLAMLRRASLCRSCAKNPRVEATCELGSFPCSCCPECRELCGVLRRNDPGSPHGQTYLEMVEALDREIISNMRTVLPYADRVFGT